MIRLHKTAYALLLVVFMAPPAFSSTITVHTAADLESAVNEAKPGDRIIIANGKYTGWSCKLTGNGTADKPVIIQAETNGGVSFSGAVNQTVLTVGGSNLEISGLTFESCQVAKNAGKLTTLIEFDDSEHCRLTNCTFEKNEVMSQFMPIVIISGKADANRVDHCRFISNVNNQEVQVKITKNAVPLHTLIDNNEFRDKAKVTWPVFNGGECVQVGQDPVLLGTQRAFTTVRDNRFIHCDGEPEVISNKSSDNKYIHNYLENCHGELVMRGGHDCVIDSNTIKGGAGGIRINGSHHTVTHNDISDVPTGIRLMYGMAKGKTEIGFYIAATDCIITDNRISNAKTGILVGDSKNADWTGKFDVNKYPSRTMQDVPPADNNIQHNQITGAVNDIDRKDQ